MYVGWAPVEVSGELLEIYRSTCPGARLRGLHRWQDMQRRKKKVLGWTKRGVSNLSARINHGEAEGTGALRGGGFAGREGGG